MQFRSALRPTTPMAVRVGLRLCLLAIRLADGKRSAAEFAGPRGAGPNQTTPVAPLACETSDDDEAEFDESPDWNDLPEEDVLSAFDEDGLEDELLDDWRTGGDDDEPTWFD